MFVCNVKYFAIAILVFFFLLVILSGRTDKSFWANFLKITGNRLTKIWLIPWTHQKIFPQKLI